jgi:hypothetical protein
MIGISAPRQASRSACREAFGSVPPTEPRRGQSAWKPAVHGLIFIERVNAPFLAAGGTAEDFRARIERAIALGWLWRHESGTYVRFTDAGWRCLKASSPARLAASVAWMSDVGSQTQAGKWHA